MNLRIGDIVRYDRLPHMLFAVFEPGEKETRAIGLKDIDKVLRTCDWRYYTHKPNNMLHFVRHDAEYARKIRRVRAVHALSQ